MGLYLVTGSLLKKCSCNEVIREALSHVTGVLIKGELRHIEGGDERYGE